MIIYKATCIINNKIYIGITTRELSKRKERHIADAFNKESNLSFHRSLRKHGLENFTWDILEDSIKSKEQLNKRERYWIKKLKSNNAEFGYNLTSGGDGGDTYSNNPRYEEICEKHRQVMLNETPEAKYNRTKKLKGQRRSKSTREKISKARMGIVFTEEHIKNIGIKVRESLIGRKIYNIRKVNCLNSDGTFIKTYESAADCARDLNIPKQGIWAVCNNIRKQHKGYKFEYYK